MRKGINDMYDYQIAELFKQYNFTGDVTDENIVLFAEQSKEKYWYFGQEVVGLPNEVEIPKDIYIQYLYEDSDDSFLTDWLSDLYGFVIFG